MKMNFSVDGMNVEVLGMYPRQQEQVGAGLVPAGTNVLSVAGSAALFSERGQVVSVTDGTPRLWDEFTYVPLRRDDGVISIHQVTRNIDPVVKYMKPTGTGAFRLYDAVASRGEIVVDKRGKSPLEEVIGDGLTLKDTSVGLAIDLQDALRTACEDLTPASLQRVEAVVDGYAQSTKRIQDILSAAKDAEKASLQNHGSLARARIYNASSEVVEDAIGSVQSVQESGHATFEELHSASEDKMSSLIEVSVKIDDRKPDYKELAHELSRQYKEMTQIRDNNKRLNTSVAAAEQVSKTLSSGLRDSNAKLQTAQFELDTLQLLDGNEERDAQIKQLEVQIESLASDISKVNGQLDTQKKIIREGKAGEAAGTIRINALNSEMSPKHETQNQRRKLFYDAIDTVKDTMVDEDLRFVQKLEAGDKKALERLNGMTDKERDYFERELGLRKKQADIIDDQVIHLEVLPIIDGWGRLIAERARRISTHLFSETSRVTTAMDQTNVSAAQSMSGLWANQAAKMGSHDQAANASEAMLNAEYTSLITEASDRLARCAALKSAIVTFKHNQMLALAGVEGDKKSVAHMDEAIGAIEDPLLKVLDGIGKNRGIDEKITAMEQTQIEQSKEGIFLPEADMMQVTHFQIGARSAVSALTNMQGIYEYAKAGVTASRDVFGQRAEATEAAAKRESLLMAEYLGQVDIDNGFMSTTRAFLLERQDELRGIAADGGNESLEKAFHRQIAVAGIVAEQSEAILPSPSEALKNSLVALGRVVVPAGLRNTLGIGNYQGAKSNRKIDLV